MNKRLCLFVILMMILCLDTSAETRSRKRIAISHGGQAPGHLEHFAPADEPDAYFDAYEMVIIIEADGFANYYDVDIISLSTMFTDISTLVGGYGGDVDVSSLAADEYKIVITSSNNNVYEGYFTVE